MTENQENELLGMVSFEWDPVRAKEVAREEALEEGIEKGRIEGRAEGRIEGRVEGRAEGREEARAEAREEDRKKTNRFVLSLLKNKAPMYFITDATNLSVEEVERIAREHQLAY